VDYCYWILGDEETLLGGELVGGEVVSWWKARWWQNSLVAKSPDFSSDHLYHAPVLQEIYD